MRVAAMLLALASGAAAQQVQTVPGYGDFLAVDGDSVWITNTGRIERWGRAGRLASVDLPGPCGTPAISGADLWVADCKLGALHRIDRRTARRTATIMTGIADRTGELNVVAGAGAIWVASDAKGEVARVDARSGRITARIPVAAGTSFLSFGHGAVWAVSGPKASLQRLDPAKGRVTGRTGLGRQPGFLAAGEGAVWVQEQGDGTLARVDPATVSVTARVKVGANLKWGDIDTGDGHVWLRTTEDQELVAINARTLAIAARLGRAVGSGAVRVAPGGVWSSAHDVHALSWWPWPEPIAR